MRMYDVKFRSMMVYKPEYIDTSSPYILKDESKCILVINVSEFEQVADRQVLTFANRVETKVVFDADMTIEESSCVSCNRCVTICPVGALVDKRLMGKSRIWDGEVTEFKCKSCEHGCDFEVLSKNGKMWLREKRLLKVDLYA